MPLGLGSGGADKEPARRPFATHRASRRYEVALLHFDTSSLGASFEIADLQITTQEGISACFPGLERR